MEVIRLAYNLIYQSTKIFMNQEFYSFPFSQEQKQVAFNLSRFCQLPQVEASLFGQNQSLGRLTCQKKQQQREAAVAKAGRKSKRGDQQLKNLNRGHWSIEQNKKYHWFLQIHYKHFVNRHMRRTDKIFKTMQIFIGSRQAEQCRSHHQKMQKKYLNFISIISNLRHIHYATQDLAPILQEIDSHGIQKVGNLATLEQLEDYKQIKDDIEPPPLKKLASNKSPNQVKVVQKVAPIEPQKSEIVANAEQYKQHQNYKQPQNYKQHQNQEIIQPLNMFDESRNIIGDILIYHQKEDNSCLFQSIFQNPQ